MLEDIAHRAGFRDVSFVYEPIAAAYHYEETANDEEIVLIADIGGGTSDFSVIRIGPQRRARPDRTEDILANAGQRIGGTDFDRLLSLATVMPLLGMGTQLVSKSLPMPKSLYFELATWSLINWAYTRKNEREVAELVADSCTPERVSRLLKTLKRRLGHRIAFAIEDAKIALSDSDATQIALSFLEADLDAPATRAGFDKAIHEKDLAPNQHRARTASATRAFKPDDVSTIFFTGGSSRVPAVRDAIAAAAPSARIAAGSDFLSVALGLTREAQRRYKYDSTRGMSNEDAHMTIRTTLCDMLGIKYPIMLAGMGGVSYAELAAAVSNAGGFGTLGMAGRSHSEIADEIKKVRDLTDKPFGVDLLAAVPESLGAYR